MTALRRLSVLLALLAFGGGPAAVPAAAQRADQGAGAVADDDGAVDEPEVDLDAEEPGEDQGADEGADLCELDVDVEAEDAPADAEDAPAQDDGDDGPADEIDETDEDAGDDSSCDQEAGDDLAQGGTLRLTRAALLRAGRVDTGHLRVARGAVVSSELRVGTGARAAGTRGRALGHLRVVARSTGELHLVVRLDRAGRRTLRARPGLRTLVVQTTVRPRHGAARVTRGTLRLTPHA